MTLTEALVKIKDHTNDYFLHLMGEFSNLATLTEPQQFSEREKYRRFLDSFELSPELYQQYIIHDCLQPRQEKYLLIGIIVQTIIGNHLFDSNFYLSSNASKEKQLLDLICQAQAKSGNNHYPQQLLHELSSVATLIQILSEGESSNTQAILYTLTQYKEALRESHMQVRDFFSNIVLSILHPLFVLPKFNRTYPTGYTGFWPLDATTSNVHEDMDSLLELDHSNTL